LMANSNESKFLVCQELSDFNDFLLILGSNSPNYCLIMEKTKEKKKGRENKSRRNTDCEQV
jgi:hypothetical protein